MYTLQHSDKIGSANFFWSFPSKVFQDKKNEQEKIANQINRCKAAVIENKNNIIQQKEARCATGRREKMARYEELLLEDKELDSTLLAGRSNDPEEVIYYYLLGSFCFILL
jgi:nitrogen fixation-related uncharacterized protein